MNPLVVLGLDAADPDLLMAWAKEGCLPTIASLMEKGCWANLSGPELICEHGIWVSLFSGISRGDHGYYYLRQLKPGTYKLQTMHGEKLQVPPFWSFFKAKKSFIMDVPDSFPINGVDGIQIGNWAIHNMIVPDWSEPKELLGYIRSHFGPRMQVEEKQESSHFQDRLILRELIKRVAVKGDLCRHLLQNQRFDLVAAVFCESHTATHQFWKYHLHGQNGEKASEEAGLTHAIRDVYQAIDREIGLLLTQMPQDANIFLISSTGMRDQYSFRYLIEDFCIKLGYQATKLPSPSLRPLDMARRLVPQSWRIALSRSLGRETREGLLSDYFEKSTDWCKTTAFAIPSAFTSFIRVNLRGREPQGIIEKGSQYESLLNQLEEDLNKLIDPKTGKPAVEEVQRTTTLFGKEASISLPDIFVNWKPTTYFVDKVIHPKAVLTQEKPEFFRKNDHTRSGWLVAQGPAIKHLGAIGNVSLLDLVPTFLRILGEPTPAYLKGKLIQTMLTPPL